ncbi:hypothetical protein B566_EDAN008066 [Ephemera danica]|nr:hypothetical protein B566_EDAN008066 [Ephemera danica]
MSFTSEIPPIFISTFEFLVHELVTLMAPWWWWKWMLLLRGVCAMWAPPLYLLSNNSAVTRRRSSDSCSGLCHIIYSVSSSRVVLCTSVVIHSSPLQAPRRPQLARPVHVDTPRLSDGGRDSALHVRRRGTSCPHAQIITTLLSAPDNTLESSGDVGCVPPVPDLRDYIPTKPSSPPTQKWCTVNRKGRIKPEQHEQFSIPLNNRFEPLDTFNFVSGSEIVYTSEYHNINFVDDMIMNASLDYSIAHCVSRDLHCGAGFANCLKSLYFGKSGMEILKSQERNVGEVSALPIEHGRFILSLVTKELYYGKPTLRNIELSLWSLKRFCHEFGVYNVAMPLIACGLDKQKWSKVQKLIEKIFGHSIINIKIYTGKERNLDWPLPGESIYSPLRRKSPSRRKSNRVKTPRSLISSTPSVSLTLSDLTTTSLSNITVSDDDDVLVDETDGNGPDANEAATLANVEANVVPDGDDAATLANVEDDVVSDGDDAATLANVEDDVNTA